MSIARHEVGPRLSQAVRHGDTIYIAGQVDDSGPSVTAQTEGILRKIDGLLKHFGSDKTKILYTTIYLTDMAHFAEMNAVWDAWVAPGHTPARATVQARLAAPKYLVEIQMIAAA
ncbi:MAG: RidA family protein [Candidatus Rokuibacteriota bacterium]